MTRENSWPKRCSVSCRNAVWRGRPGLAKACSTLEGITSVGPLDGPETRWMRNGAPPMARGAGPMPITSSATRSASCSYTSPGVPTFSFVCRASR